MRRFRISFIGAGRVARSLGLAFHERGHEIVSIVSRNKRTGSELAGSLGAFWSDQPVLGRENDITFVAVPDNSLGNLLHSLNFSGNPLIVHTAGSYGLEVFPNRIENRGVFYPLQTFSEGRRPDFSRIPVFIETDNESNEKLLTELAESLGCKTYKSDLYHRKLLHLAAVFVSNFTNHMLTGGKLIAGKAGFSLEILQPLIDETIAKSVASGPEVSQTGPAVRFDMNTIKMHLDLLSFSPELQRVYREISNSIMSHHKAQKGNE